MVLLVVLAIVLAVLPLTLLPGSPSAVQSVLASVGSIVLLVFALFSLVRDTFSAWQLVSALALLALLVTGALLVWRHVEQTRPVTVTDEVGLTSVTGEKDGPKRMGDGEVVHLTLRVPRPRDELRVTFAAEDLDPLGSPCVPSSSLQLTGAGLDGRKKTRPGREVSVDLDRSERRVRLKVRLETGPGCLLSLEVTKAVLRNR